MPNWAFVFAADDGEGAQDVGGVIAGEAVEVEVEGVEAGAEVAALLFVPAEGRAVVAEVAGERGQVVGGVGEAQHVVADQLAGGGAAERPVVVGGGDDGELFNEVYQLMVVPCNLLLVIRNRKQKLLGSLIVDERPPRQRTQRAAGS